MRLREIPALERDDTVLDKVLDLVVRYIIYPPYLKRNHASSLHVAMIFYQDSHKTNFVTFLLSAKDHKILQPSAIMLTINAIKGQMNESAS